MGSSAVGVGVVLSDGFSVNSRDAVSTEVPSSAAAGGEDSAKTVAGPLSRSDCEAYT